MNRKQFLNELDRGLRKIPHSDRSEMLNDFEEHFEVGLLDDKTEEEVSEELGNPKAIARDLLAEYTVNQAEKEKSVSNISRAIYATLGLSLLNLIFVLGPIVAIATVWITISAVGIGFALTPILWIGSIITNQVVDLIGEFFIVLTLSSLGVLISIGMIYVGKFLYQLILRYIKFNIRIVKG